MCSACKTQLLKEGCPTCRKMMGSGVSIDHRALLSALFEVCTTGFSSLWGDQVAHQLTCMFSKVAALSPEPFQQWFEYINRAWAVKLDTRAGSRGNDTVSTHIRQDGVNAVAVLKQLLDTMCQDVNAQIKRSQGALVHTDELKDQSKAHFMQEMLDVMQRAQYGKLPVSTLRFRKQALSANIVFLYVLCVYMQNLCISSKGPGQTVGQIIAELGTAQGWRPTLSIKSVYDRIRTILQRDVRVAVVEKSREVAERRLDQFTYEAFVDYCKELQRAGFLYVNEASETSIVSAINLAPAQVWSDANVMAIESGIANAKLSHLVVGRWCSIEPYTQSYGDKVANILSWSVKKKEGSTSAALARIAQIYDKAAANHRTQVYRTVSTCLSRANAKLADVYLLMDEAYKRQVDESCSLALSSVRRLMSGISAVTQSIRAASFSIIQNEIKLALSAVRNNSLLLVHYVRSCIRLCVQGSTTQCDVMRDEERAFICKQLAELFIELEDYIVRMGIHPPFLAADAAAIATTPEASVSRKRERKTEGADRDLELECADTTHDVLFMSELGKTAYFPYPAQRYRIVRVLKRISKGGRTNKDVERLAECIEKRLAERNSKLTKAQLESAAGALQSDKTFMDERIRYASVPWEASSVVPYSNMLKRAHEILQHSIDAEGIHELVQYLVLRLKF